MAENEYLDSTKSRRWQSVVQVIRGGGSIEEVAASVEDGFYKALRQIRKDFPLGDMIRAMEHPDELLRLCQSVDGGGDVKDFLTQAAFEKSGWDHPIDVKLPFDQMTKGELVRSLNSADLRDLARATVSCVSYPLHHRTRKSCGLCAACLFRRVALNAAGIDEVRGMYQSDVLDHAPLSLKKLNYLKAFLNQIDSLDETDAGRLPVSISKHLYQTGMVERGGSTKVYVELYRKYRREWSALFRKQS